MNRESLRNWWSRWRDNRRRPFQARLAWVLTVVIVAGVFLLNGMGGQEVAQVLKPSPTPDARWHQFHSECATYGVAYRDPRSRAAHREAVFGPPDTPENRATVAFFGFAMDVHKKVAPCLGAVERDLRDQGTTYPVEAVSSYRAGSDSKPHWFHQYGGAVDVNSARNPQCLESGGGLDPEGRCGQATPYDIPPEWVDTFERYGFYWGGNFRRTKDYMHFEWHGEGP